MTSLICHQVNLQSGFGGGEVYTLGFVRSLASLGVQSILYINPKCAAWRRFDLPEGTQLVPVRTAEDLPDLLTGPSAAWVVFHTLPAPSITHALRSQGHYLSAFVHMPLFGRSPQPLQPFDLLIPVSAYVSRTLLDQGLCQIYDEPMYGFALLQRDHRPSSPALIRRHSRYDWDLRKVRERFLSFLEPAWEITRPELVFAKRSGLTLGIVSRLTPIKQFPLLMSLITPVLRRYPDVSLEIFGAGGYASVRDLRKAVRGIKPQVRFWGHQDDMAAVYAQIDVLLTGLPEKEALGLNVIEAQSLGVPVLAPDAPPFNETVKQGVSGLRYVDPRLDGGHSFETALNEFRLGNFRWDAMKAEAHLRTFSVSAFEQRCAKLIGSIRSKIPELDHG